MLDRYPAQRFSRSSLIPSLPSARLSLRHSLSRKRRRAAKQLQPATTPLPPIPEVASREVTPTPAEATTAAAPSSSAYTSGFTSETSGLSTAATSAQTGGIDTAETSPKPPSPPSSPAAWWLNLPYPSASPTPLPPLDAELTPGDPWRNSFAPVLKAWERYVGRHLLADSSSPAPSLSLHIPAATALPPPQQGEEGHAAAGAPRLATPPPISSSSSSARGSLLRDEDIRWTATGSPVPPAVPAKDQHRQPHHHTGPFPFPLPSPTPSEPPSPRSSCSSSPPLSPFSSPPASPSPHDHDNSLPEVVPEQGGGLHPTSPQRPQPQQGRGGRRPITIRRASSFPPPIPRDALCTPPPPSPSPSRGRQKGRKTRGPVPAVRVKKTRVGAVWERVKAMKRARRGEEEKDGDGEGRWRRVWWRRWGGA